jgi:hypothetical protein
MLHADDRGLLDFDLLKRRLLFRLYTCAQIDSSGPRLHLTPSTDASFYVKTHVQHEIKTTMMLNIGKPSKQPAKFLVDTNSENGLNFKADLLVRLMNGKQRRSLALPMAGGK